MATGKAFISRMPCGHVVASSWDDEHRPFDAISKFVSQEERQGCTVSAEKEVPGREHWIDDNCRHGRCSRPIARQSASE